MERDLAYGANDKQAAYLYPCDTYKDYPAACYRYKLRRLFPPHKTDFRLVSEECMKLKTSKERNGCFHGLGFSYYKFIYSYPENLSILCSYGDFVDKRMCIEGAIGILAVYNRTIANRACSFLSNESRKICEDSMKVTNFGMGRDFEIYYQENPNAQTILTGKYN
jgi:hypothetical protein